MSNFQIILRDWVTTSGFFTHALVKRFFLFYPILCIASDCYLQVQVAFQAWFETIDSGAAADEAQEPALAPGLLQESYTSLRSREPERHVAAAEPASNPEENINIEEAVRNFLAEDLRSEGSTSEERWD